MVLLALVLMVTATSAIEPQAELNVTKVVSSTGPYAVNDTVTWMVTVWNNGPDAASDIILKEDISQLSGHKDISVEISDGAYDSSTGAWSITRGRINSFMRGRRACAASSPMRMIEGIAGKSAKE